MSGSCKVYLVGDKDAPKKNSWMAITNSLEEAEKFLTETPKAVNMKTIEVKERHRGRS